MSQKQLDTFDLYSWVGRDTKTRGFSSKCGHPARLGFRVAKKFRTHRFPRDVAAFRLQ